MLQLPKPMQDPCQVQGVHEMATPFRIVNVPDVGIDTFQVNIPLSCKASCGVGEFAKLARMPDCCFDELVNHLVMASLVSSPTLRTVRAAHTATARTLHHVLSTMFTDQCFNLSFSRASRPLARFRLRSASIIETGF